MKHISILFVLVINLSFVYAQYDKEKLTKILTSNAWSVKTNVDRLEKKFTFNKDMTAMIAKDNGKGVIASQKEKWSITSSDNIRWFISIGTQTYELIISYAKDGSQYVKLTHQAGSDKVTGYYEINLYATK